MKRQSLLLMLMLGLFPSTTLVLNPVQASEQSQDQPLRVVTKPLVPFVFEQNGELVGFSVDLWEAISNDLGLDYEWVEVETVTQQLDAVANGEADAAIAGISMTPEREERIDFSHPYFDSGLLIITQVYANTSTAALLQTIFSPTLLKILIFGLLTLLVMAHMIWLMERGSSESMPKAYLPGIWEALWWSLSTIATLEYGDGQKPRTAIKRLMAMFWVVLGIVLIAQFTASITASLTVTQLSGSIQGPSDLPGKRIATVSGTTSAQYLEAERLSYTGVTTIEEAYAILEAGDVDAVVYDAPVLLYYVLKEGRGKVQIAGSIFEEDTYGIALPAGSELREPINHSLLRLRENGTYSTIYSKWFQSENR